MSPSSRFLLSVSFSLYLARAFSTTIIELCLSLRFLSVGYAQASGYDCRTNLLKLNLSFPLSIYFGVFCKENVRSLLLQDLRFCVYCIPEIGFLLRCHGTYLWLFLLVEFFWLRKVWLSNAPILLAKLYLSKALLWFSLILLIYSSNLFLSLFALPSWT